MNIINGKKVIEPSDFDTIRAVVNKEIELITSNLKSLQNRLILNKVLSDTEHIYSVVSIRNVKIRLLFNAFVKLGVKPGVALDKLSNMRHDDMFLCRETIRNIVYFDSICTKGAHDAQ